MRTLILGKNGQLARALAIEFDPANTQNIFLDHSAFNFIEFERHRGNVEKLIAQSDVVINAAGYTDVNGAEINQQEAMMCNAYGPEQVALLCKKHNATFFHVSTDYVYDGSKKEAWLPTDDTNALNHYGYSKSIGDELILQTNGKNIIIRTSWVFSDFGNNFVKTIIDKARKHDKITVVNDQIGGPTSTYSIAELIKLMATNPQLCTGEIYHFSGSPDVSWYDFAKEIISHYPITCSVEPIQTDSVPCIAARPKNSKLDCSYTEEQFGISRPEWKKDLHKVLDYLRSKES